VDAILVAEFDIDKGSALTFQYPCSTGTDAHVLSELMLPDGAHNREEDWTMFLLNQTEAADDESSAPRPSTYVLNLVRTKHISNVRRGARVKAMAVASRYQWVHVFKPLLVLALDKFFNEPTIVILEELYHAINSMDMSRMPRLSIRQKNIFRDAEDNTVLDGVLKDDEAKLGPIISHTKSGSTSSDATQTLASEGPVLSSAAAASLKKLGKDRQYFETNVVYGGIKMPVRIPLALYPEEVGEVSSQPTYWHHSAPPIKWRNAVPYCWHPHLDIGPFTHPILVLLNAILTEKRVVFLGDKRPSGEVADYVLAACSLVGGGGLLRGFTERCFPYVSLPGLDQLLAVPGFIAGVTNPVFEEQQAWWDVLCNIGTGKITVSQRLIQASPSHDRETSREREKEWFKTSGHETDHDFIPEAMAAAQAHASEFYIRQKFLAYIRRFADVTAAYEDHLRNQGDRKSGYNVDHLNIGRGPFFVNERACLREMTILRNRVEGWRSTRSYMYYKQDLPTMIQRRAVADLD
ncbi:stabilization of polarity axis-domain-containing protein, partial [Geranomyces variabilis]